MGLVSWRNRDEAHLTEIAAQAAELHPRIEDSTWKHTVHVLDGMIAHARGDFDHAQRSLEEAVRIYAQVGFSWGVGWLTSVLGAISQQAGDLHRALNRGQRALQIFWEHGDIASVGGELVSIALAATRLGRAEAAARMLGLAAAVRDASGLVMTREAPAEATAIAETSTILGAERFAAAFATGRALAPEAGVNEAQEISPNSSSGGEETPPRAGGRFFGLTAREREVLRQLASGSTTNRDLAEALSISPKTAGNHVDNILAKLGVNSRVAAISLALKDGSV